MVIPQLLRSLIRRHTSELVLKHQSFLLRYSKNYLACSNCQFLRKLSSFHSVSCFYPVSYSNNEIKSNGYSTNANDSISAMQTIGSRIKSTFQYLGWLATRTSAFETLCSFMCNTCSGNSEILRTRARQIYACCTDDVDYKEFFRVCNMPDTLQSWFLVSHLHIWMCYVRLNMLDENGKTVNQQIADLMWEDLRERIKELGVEDTKARKEGFKELSKQFYGLTIIYNKALMSGNEKELADALYKTFFLEQSENNRRRLDVLLKYVDNQLNMLDGMTKEQLLDKPKIEWIPLTDFIDTSNK